MSHNILERNRRSIWTLASDDPVKSAALVGATSGALVASGCELLAVRRDMGLETNKVSGISIETILNSTLQPDDIRELSIMIGHCAARGYLGVLNESALQPTHSQAFEAFLSQTVTGKYGGASFNRWLRDQMEKDPIS